MKLIIEGDSLTEIHEQIHMMHYELAHPNEPKSADLDIVKHSPGADTFPSQTSDAPSVQIHAQVSNPAKVGDDSEDTELDEDGVHWDERIHSHSGEKSANGKWRKRRNLEEGVYEKITAELKAAKKPGKNSEYGTVSPKMPPMPTTATAPAMPKAPSLDQALAMTAPAPFVLAPIAAPEPVNVLQRAYSLKDFSTNISQIVSQLLTDGKLNRQWIIDTTPAFKGKDIFEWNTETAVLEQLYPMFIKWGFIKATGV